MARLKSFESHLCEDCGRTSGKVVKLQLYDAQERLVGDFCEACGNRRFKEQRAYERGQPAPEVRNVERDKVRDTPAVTYQPLQGADARGDDHLDKDGGGQEHAGGPGRDPALGDVPGSPAVHPSEGDAEYWRGADVGGLTGAGLSTAPGELPGDVGTGAVPDAAVAAPAVDVVVETTEGADDERTDGSSSETSDPGSDAGGGERDQGARGDGEPPGKPIGPGPFDPASGRPGDDPTDGDDDTVGTAAPGTADQGDVDQRAAGVDTQEA